MEEARELKAILEYFIAEFNTGNLQAIDFMGGLMMFEDSKYDILIESGKISLIEKADYKIVGAKYVKK